MIDQPSPLGSPLDGKRIVLLSFGEAYRNSETQCPLLPVAKPDVEKKTGCPSYGSRYAWKKSHTTRIR